MKIYKPDRSAASSLRIVILVMGIAVIAAMRFLIGSYTIALVLSVITALLTIFAAFIYIPVYFSRLIYLAGEKEIKKTSGVFFRSSKSIKYSAIQYSTSVTTPFSGLTGLNFVIFYVYGGKMVLLFLSRDDTLEILMKSGTFYDAEEEDDVS